MKKLESILLIDDDSVTNFYNKLLIERLGLGIEVSICLNGEDGINFLTSCLTAASLKSTLPSNQLPMRKVCNRLFRPNYE